MFMDYKDMEDGIDVYEKEQNILAKAFVWLDFIKNELENEEEIKAIEIAQKLIMTTITKYAIYL